MRSASWPANVMENWPCVLPLAARPRLLIPAKAAAADGAIWVLAGIRRRRRGSWQNGGERRGWGSDCDGRYASVESNIRYVSHRVYSEQRRFLIPGVADEPQSVPIRGQCPD